MQFVAHKQSGALNSEYGDDTLSGYGWNVLLTAKGYFINTPCNLVTGIYTMVRHPIQTVKGVGNAVSHPIVTGNAITDSICEKLNHSEGQGELVGDIALLLVPGIGAVKNTSKVARVTSQVASHADDAARIANKVDNLAKVTSKVEGVIDVGIPVQLTPELRAALITSQDVIAHTSLIGAEARGVTQIIVTSAGNVRTLARPASSGAILSTTPGVTTTVLGTYANDTKFLNLPY